MKKALLTVCVVAGLSSTAEAATFTVATNVSENESLQQQWFDSLNELGNQVDFFEDFENGFNDAQNLNTNVLQGSLTLKEGSGQVIVDQGAGAIGGSNPIDDFALESSEGSGTRAIFEFANPVDYVSFFYIDLLTVDVVINTVSGTEIFVAGPNDFNGDSAEFFGYFSDNIEGDKAVSVFFNNVGGTNGWALDNIAWGNSVAPIPLPAAGWMLLAGVAGFGAIGRRKRTQP